jgi:excisionase family DNA binding protein
MIAGIHHQENFSMDKAHCDKHDEYSSGCLRCEIAHAQNLQRLQPAKKVVDRGVHADLVTKKPPTAPKPAAAKESDLLTVAEAATMLCLQESTVRDWILRRKISYLKIGAKSIRIERETVLRILRMAKVPARTA